jgi:hypothetical protein
MTIDIEQKVFYCELYHNISHKLSQFLTHECSSIGKIIREKMGLQFKNGNQHILGDPKVNVEHTHINKNNILHCNNTKNCGEMLLEYEKCKGDYNCNFDKLNELKNNYEKCKSNLILY